MLLACPLSGRCPCKALSLSAEPHRAMSRVPPSQAFAGKQNMPDVAETGDEKAEILRATSATEKPPLRTLPIAAKCIVKISGLRSRPELNGEVGVTIAKQPNGRWTVKLPGRDPSLPTPPGHPRGTIMLSMTGDGEVVCLKPSCLTAIGAIVNKPTEP